MNKKNDYDFETYFMEVLNLKVFYGCFKTYDILRRL